MKRAEELLLHTAMPISIITEQIGYNDQFAFSTAFKKYYGESPQRYRSRIQEKS